MRPARRQIHVFSQSPRSQTGCRMCAAAGRVLLPPLPPGGAWGGNRVRTQAGGEAGLELRMRQSRAEQSFLRDAFSAAWHCQESCSWARLARGVFPDCASRSSHQAPVSTRSRTTPDVSLPEPVSCFSSTDTFLFFCNSSLCLLSCIIVGLSPVKFRGKAKGRDFRPYGRDCEAEGEGSQPAQEKRGCCS